MPIRQAGVARLARGEQAADLAAQARPAPPRRRRGSGARRAGTAPRRSASAGRSPARDCGSPARRATRRAPACRPWSPNRPPRGRRSGRAPPGWSRRSGPPRSCAMRKMESGRRPARGFPEGEPVATPPVTRASPARGRGPTRVLVARRAGARSRRRSAAHQHLRHEAAGVVGAGLDRPVGARAHHGDQVAGLHRGHLAVEGEIVAALADRADHVGDECAACRRPAR